MSVKYDLCEIERGHFIRVLKCLSADTWQAERNTIIVIIPGNPGLIEFYEHLAIELNRLTRLSVVGISHTGHIYDENVSEWDPVDLNKQIQHKLKYIEEHLMVDKELTTTRKPSHLYGDKNANESVVERQIDNIVFVGHSIGSYVILQLLLHLNGAVKSKVKRSILVGRLLFFSF